MPGIRVREGEAFEGAMKRFKKQVEKAGVLSEVRRREFYEKPTAERKRKLAAAVKRHHNRMRSILLRWVQDIFFFRLSSRHPGSTQGRPSTARRLPCSRYGGPKAPQGQPGPGKLTKSTGQGRLKNYFSPQEPFK